MRVTCWTWVSGRLLSWSRPKESNLQPTTDWHRQLPLRDRQPTTPTCQSGGYRGTLDLGVTGVRIQRLRCRGGTRTHDLSAKEPSVLPRFLPELYSRLFLGQVALHHPAQMLRGDFHPVEGLLG